MTIATKTNSRVTFLASQGKDEETRYSSAFVMAYRGGIVMGFCLVSMALFFLTVLVILYMTILAPKKGETEDFLRLFEFIAGYGLGGSSVALFCRVGGGIYTKAADVGADLVGKLDQKWEEDSPDNPATIADNVGDNVGDIAGMGSDLFGSFAESTCAALIISGTSKELISNASFFYPLLISAAGIIICLITTFFATHLMTVDRAEKIEKTLKWQLLISTILLTPVIFLFSVYILPQQIYFQNGKGTLNITAAKSSGVMGCVLCGLYSGLIIGFLTDYFTSTAHEPVQDLAKACVNGPALNIIHGLALGYNSTIIPICALSITIFVSFTLAGMYGVAMAALGMLSNLCICLAIDGYGPISDNAGGIAEMSGFPKDVRRITDALDAA
jgi:inorganic pyrophosphatase